MDTFTTPNGKELKIVNAPGTGHYKIQFTQGGELPQELTGFYTSSAVAQVAVRNYLLNNKDRFEKKAENKKFVNELKQSLKEKEQPTEE
jgi:hypothetical protein